MTPQQKAEQLISKFKLCDDGAEPFSAKKCALTLVDEILGLSEFKDLPPIMQNDDYKQDSEEDWDMYYSYWIAVKWAVVEHNSYVHY